MKHVLRGFIMADRPLADATVVASSRGLKPGPVS